MILELGQLPEIIWPPAPSPEKEAASDKLGDLPKALQQVRSPARSRPEAQGLRHASPAVPEPRPPRSRAEEITHSKQSKEK